MTKEQFGEVFDKVKQIDGSFEAIKKVVLDLAFQGKLITPSTETPSDAAKQLVLSVKQTKAKEESLRNLKPKRNVEYSYSSLKSTAPSHWSWVHLNEIAMVQGGKRLPVGETFSDVDKDYVYIRVTDLKNGTIIDSDLKFISSRVHKSISNYTISCDDLYITIAGTIASIGIVPKKFDGQNLTENAAKIVFQGISKKFLFYALSTKDAQNQLLAKVTQMAQPKLALKRISGVEIPIPPLEEQKRMVTRIDELMARCDELEAINQKKNETKLIFLKSITKNISEGALNYDEKTFLASAFENVPKNEEGIQELKKVCINFGIQMDHQSAEENDKVFGKIQELTDRMKADSVLPKSFLIQQSESELFSKLACLSLGSIAFIEKGKTGIKSAEPGKYPLVVTAVERKTCKSYDFESEAAMVPLVSSTGHGHASIHRLHYQSGRFALGTILAAVIPFEEELFSARFIYEYLTTFKEELLVSRMTGTANVTLSISKIAEVPIPMVSPHTQKWICDFCETCDQLAISYKKEKSIQHNLLKNLVA